jgi:hypothetical protein
MSFKTTFEKLAAIPGKLNSLKKMLAGVNPISKYLAKQKLRDHQLNAMRTAFRNPSKASTLMDKSDIYKKVSESL